MHDFLWCGSHLITIYWDCQPTQAKRTRLASVNHNHKKTSNKQGTKNIISNELAKLVYLFLCVEHKECEDEYQRNGLETFEDADQ